MSSAALQQEQQPIIACTVSRDVQNFDLSLASNGAIWRLKTSFRSWPNQRQKHFAF